MRAPVLVTPASSMPVTLDEAKLHLKVEFPDEDGVIPETPEDTLIEGLIAGAVSHLDGWTGILGRCLVEQTWRMDFDSFQRQMRLPLGPVGSVVSVTWRNAAGQMATIDDGNYLLLNDSGGGLLVFRNSYSLPTGLQEDPGAVSVTFKAGYPDAEGKTTVPAALRVAILLMVGHWYENRETVSEGGLAEVPFAANVLIAPFRRMAV